MPYLKVRILTKSTRDVLAQTNRIVFNVIDGSFSFISKDGATLWRGGITKETIRILGGKEKLKRYINDIRSGKIRVNVSIQTLDKLEAALILSEL